MALDLDNMLEQFEGGLVEEGGDSKGPVKNILGKSGQNLSLSTQAIRAQQPGHLQNKFRTVVCRWWLQGSCMKGDSCEFLHKIERDRMPDCHKGAKCPDQTNGKCSFKHPKEDELTCTFFSQGFCPHGRACNSEHVQKPLSALPLFGEYNKGQTFFRPPQSGAEWFATDAEIAKRREAGPNILYKSQLCKHFMQTGGTEEGGVCPYGDDCHFAHGELQVRQPDHRKQRQLQALRTGQAAGGSQAQGQGAASAVSVAALAQLGALPAGFALKDDEEPYRLFMLKCFSIRNLARSLRQKVWRVRKAMVPALNEAFYSGDKVLLLFSQIGTNQVQGCATMLSPIPTPAPAKRKLAKRKGKEEKKRATEEAPGGEDAGGGGGGDENQADNRKGQEGRDGELAQISPKKEEEEKEDERGEKRGEEVSKDNYEEDDDDDDEEEEEDDDEEVDLEEQFSGHFGVSWDRGEGCMRECGMELLEDLPNKLHYFLPCSLAADGQEISSLPEVGGVLLRRLWRSPEPQLEPEPYMADTELDLSEEGRCAKDGGYVFATWGRASVGECIDKRLLGVSEAQQFEVAFVQPGTPLFLLNEASQELVFGVLVCESEYPTLLDPTAWVHTVPPAAGGLGPGVRPDTQAVAAATTPLPAQVQFKQALMCKPLRVDDPALLKSLGRFEALGEGPLTGAETARVVEALAKQQYLANVEQAARQIMAQQGLLLSPPPPQPTTAATAEMAMAATSAATAAANFTGGAAGAVVSGVPAVGAVTGAGGALPLPAGPPPQLSSSAMLPPPMVGPPPQHLPPLARGGGGGGSGGSVMPPPWWRMERPGTFFQVIVLGMESPPNFDLVGELRSGLRGYAIPLWLRGEKAAAVFGGSGAQGEPLQLVVAADDEGAVARAVNDVRPVLERCWHKVCHATGGRLPPPGLPCQTPVFASSAHPANKILGGGGPPPGSGGCGGGGCGCSGSCVGGGGPQTQTAPPPPVLLSPPPPSSFQQMPPAASGGMAPGDPRAKRARR